ncbi:porin [Enterobacteriaceae endosymbiont of Donacia thalassina]|uniref:porin n=1 Tax=Enterobacteriaceae endosymbiont of Donacia thalassina TaxID=2675786 RepID=UPI001448CDC3|nr:porin [Enterobacteriaceae endosymbiont of Donacia thalassina]QJC37394.1 porin [Enterobacteriaceae endosymbiont of Donacia thalassina]
MKYNILKFLIPFLLIISSITTTNASEIYNKNGQKIDLYGFLNIKKAYSKNRKNIPEKYENIISNMIFGLKGTTNIFNDVYGYAQFEYSLPINQSEIDKNIFPSVRLGLIGLNFNHGNSSIDFGRNYGILYDTTSYIKKKNFFTDDLMYNYNDKFMFGRTNNLLTYRNKNFFGLIKGLDISLQYKSPHFYYENDVFYNKRNNRDRDIFLEKEKNKKGWGASIRYKIGNSGVSITGSYFNSSKIIDKNDELKKVFFIKNSNNNDNNINAFSIGAKYEKNNIYLATVFSEAKNSLTYLNRNNYYFANKIKNLEIIGQYKFSDNLQATISYIQSEGNNIPAGYHYAGGNISFLKYVTINTIYKFNKNLSAYFDYRINLLNKNNRYIKSNDIFTDNIFGIGLIYNF